MMRLFTLRQELTGRQVLAALFGFFGLMAVANAFFVYYAISTFNGFETRDAYRSGLLYNQRVAASEAQAALGWKTGADYDKASGLLRIAIADRMGAPLAGLSVRGRLGRPVSDSEDRELILREVASGAYEAKVDLHPGQWILSVELYASNRRDLPIYRMKDRIWVKEGS